SAFLVRLEPVRKAWMIPAAFLLAAIINSPTPGKTFQLMTRAAAINPDTAKFFPWAKSPEGFARLLLGDFAASLGAIWNVAAALLVIGFTTIGCFALVVAALK